MFKSVILLWFALTVTSAYKILVVFPYPGKSHTILGDGYVKHLLRAGHEVTYITPIPIKDVSKNLRQIDVSSNAKLFTLLAELDVEKLIKKQVNPSNTANVIGFINRIANNTLWNPSVRELLFDTNERFDVVIVEWLYTELYSGFATVFNCPLIWSSSIEPHGLVLSLIDEDPNPAYTANHMSVAEAPFTFTQRVQELMEVIYLKYLKWSIYDYESKIFEEGYGPAVALRGRQLPSLYEVSRNASLMLGNSHVSTGRAVRLPVNYKDIAGYHIDEEVQPLPQDLQKLMDESEHGVIYFSLGSMVKSKTLPEELKQGLLKLFGDLKQTVIWKLEENLPNRPKNVHMLQWAPQQSILAHKKCILFISHGGLLSTTEALHYGVPMIGVPLFVDQFINVDRAVKKGFAKRVDIGFDTHVHMKSAIEEMISNPMYRQRAHELSLVYHDRPVPPGAELVHWVEHVARTRGAPHLRSPALHVPIYQKMYLDLLALVVVCLTLMVMALKRLIRGKAVDKNKKIK